MNAPSDQPSAAQSSISDPNPSSRYHWGLYVPKLITVLREGYSLAKLRGDVMAGLTVAVVALPLSMALAIASGTTPDRGLITAVVAGFLISALGGSRFQIGGPTGAFVVIVYDIIQRHGYDGLVLATLMAGVIMIAFGLARLGTYIKYIPYPVITGLTSGIALIIFSSQIKDLLGLSLEEVPPGFVAKWEALVAALPSVSPPALGVAALTLALIVLLRRFRPTWPAFLIGVSAGAIAVWAFGLPVETIGSRFGGIPQTIPAPHMPSFTWAQVQDLLPDALTIALLASIESLLSAVVADGMTGRRHRSNCELVGQGVANLAAAAMGGFCATGAIARTATNIRSGAHSPISGMIHALALLAFILVAAPLASYLPLASLAATLVVVAWNMSEHHHFRHLLKAPPGDILMLLATFFLTVLVDLTVAIQVGVVMAAILFMHRMAHAVEAESGVKLIADDVNEFTTPDTRPAYDPSAQKATGPAQRDTAVYTINGPFFFGVAAKLQDVLDQIGGPPKRFVIDMANVPVIDATAAHALETVVETCRKSDTALILRNVRPGPRTVLHKLGLIDAQTVHFEDTSKEPQ
jgi:SulP family sulfate permease